MAVPPTTSPARPGWFARLWDRVRAARPWVRWVVGVGVLLAVVGVGVGAVVVVNKLDQRQRAQAAVEQWARFDKAARAGDETEIRSALDTISALTADPQCDRYRETISSGDAPPDDPRLCLLTTTLHARGGRWAEAAREARKRLAHEPDDWISRCLVALAALAAGDPTTARAELDRLPDPAGSGPNPAGLLLAHDLFRRTGRDTTPLRRFVNDVVVDVLNSPGVDDDPPAVKVELIDCYLLGFDDPPPARLGSAIAAVVRLADAAAQSDDATVLTRLGVSCNRLTAAIDRLHRAKQMTVGQRDGLAKEHEARTARVWRRVKEVSPCTPAAYHGLAQHEVRANRLPAAIDEVRAGLKECGNDAGLLALYSLLLRATDRTDDALRTLAAAADADPTNLQLLLLVAETALDAPRRDVAAIALRHAAAVAPTDPRVIRLGVRLKLQGGDTHGALQRLRDLGEPALLDEPLLVRIYTRALHDAGLGVLLPDWLERVGKRENAAVAAAAVRGLTDTAFDDELAPLASRLIDRTLARWPSDADALAARAVLLARWAEYGSTRWEPVRTRDAAFALERVRAMSPEDADTAAMLGRIRLKGLNDSAKAAKDIAPLIDVRDRGALLTGEQLAVVGMVQLANGQTEPAISALEAARKLGPPSAAVCVHLALAYHTRGDTDRGRPLVVAARRLPHTPQDDADLTALPATLRETP